MNDNTNNHEKRNAYEIYVSCPHCDGEVVIMRNQINCSIFRHGIYKHNNKQMSPHAPKRECDMARMDGLIYGCGKPFQLKMSVSGHFDAVVCDYI